MSNLTPTPALYCCSFLSFLLVLSLLCFPHSSSSCSSSFACYDHQHTDALTTRIQGIHPKRRGNIKRPTKLRGYLGPRSADQGATFSLLTAYGGLKFLHVCLLCVILGFCLPPPPLVVTPSTFFSFPFFVTFLF